MRNPLKLVFGGTFLLLIAGTIDARHGDHGADRHCSKVESYGHQRKESGFKTPDAQNIEALCNFGSEYPSSGCHPLNQSRCQHFSEYCSWDENSNLCLKRLSTWETFYLEHRGNLKVYCNLDCIAASLKDDTIKTCSGFIAYPDIHMPKNHRACSPPYKRWRCLRNRFCTP